MTSTCDAPESTEASDHTTSRNELGKVRVSTLMSTDLVSVSPEMPLNEAARLLVEKAIGGAPVIDGSGVPLGFLSKTDVARVVAVGAPAAAFTVREAMTPAALTAPGSARLHEVADVMVRAGVHRILIVDPQGRALGILTNTDVLRWIAQG